jgi:hypothetical protein
MFDNVRNTTAGSEGWVRFCSDDGLQISIGVFMFVRRRRVGRVRVVAHLLRWLRSGVIRMALEIVSALLVIHGRLRRLGKLNRKACGKASFSGEW